MSMTITFHGYMSRGGGAYTPARARISEAVTVAATASTQSGSAGELCTVTAEVDLYVEFGAAPNGSGSTRHRLKAGSNRTFAILSDGEKAAFAVA